MRIVSSTAGRMAALGLWLWAATCAAQPAEVPLQGTLARIAETATISLGHREASLPFSYYDEHHQVVGYSQELMLAVADEVKRALKLPALTLRLVPVTSQNRMALVRDGTVDLECGSTSNTAERGREVAFSTSIFVVGTRLLVPRGSPVKDFADLDGRKVVVTAGTTSERLLRQWSARPGRRFQLLTARDHQDAFRVLQEGRVDAMMLDDALLFGLRARAANPQDWQVVGTPMSQEVYGCMMRRNDAPFKAVVDRALTRILRSGEARKIYARWFQQPIPPHGVNLDMPPSPALLRLYDQPGDQPLP
jgi:glutamate/aspartate transport system substrate-binding protein